MTTRVELLTVKEYAELMRVHPQTVYTAIRMGRLKHKVERVGRVIRVFVSRETAKTAHDRTTS